MCEAGKKILIVEDTKSVSILLSAALKREGLRVDVAETIESARRLTSENNISPIKYDLVLVDINLPDGDGTALLRELASSLWHNVRYAISADASCEAKQRALDAGADRYVTKPFNIRTLIDWISEELGGRRVTRYGKDDGNWDEEKNQLVFSYVAHLESVCEELQTPMSFKSLKSRLHQLRGSATLYGFKRISALATDLSEHLTLHGPAYSADVRGTLRHEILVTLNR